MIVANSLSVLYDTLLIGSYLARVHCHRVAYTYALDRRGTETSRTCRALAGCSTRPATVRVRSRVRCSCRSFRPRRARTRAVQATPYASTPDRVSWTASILLLVVPTVALAAAKLIHRSGFFTDSSEVINTEYGKRISHSYSSSFHHIVGFVIFFCRVSACDHIDGIPSRYLCH